MAQRFKESVAHLHFSTPVPAAHAATVAALRDGLAGHGYRFGAIQILGSEVEFHGADLILSVCPDADDPCGLVVAAESPAAIVGRDLDIDRRRLHLCAATVDLLLKIQPSARVEWLHEGAECVTHHGQDAPEAAPRPAAVPAARAGLFTRLRRRFMPAEGDIAVTDWAPDGR